MKHRELTRLILLTALLVLSMSGSAIAKKHSVLVVLTHRDDIVSVAALLAKTSAEGHTVYYAMFTGVQERGYEEGGKGEEELQCVRRALGIKETFVMRGPAGESQATIAAVAERLIEIVDQTKPDVIVTWGPEGHTGHPRHIMVGNVVTRVFQQRALLKHKPRKLYYVAYPESVFPDTRLPFGRTADVDGPFGNVSEEFITTRVDGGRYLKETRAAIECFKLTQEENQKWQQKWTERLTVTLGGRVHLRLVMPVARRRETSIFTGL